MVEIDIKLSKSSVNSAINKLKKLQEQVQNNTGKANADIVRYGKNVLDSNISQIWNFDGNEQGITIDVPIDNNTAELHWLGDQIAYLEFGTGPLGASTPYPVQEPVPWEAGKRNRWTYFKNGEFHDTSGIPAFAPMYEASQEMKKQAKISYKDILTKR